MCRSGRFPERVLPPPWVPLGESAAFPPGQDDGEGMNHLYVYYTNVNVIDKVMIIYHLINCLHHKYT